MSSRLEEILQTKRNDLQHAFRTVREAEFSRFADVPRPSFARALRGDGQISVIAEIKRRSPSAGAICADADPVEVARQYVNGQADALSVLTDTPYFGGRIADLWEVTEFLQNHRRNVPVLRKDFTVHPIQILEAAEAGASAVLLIVAALQSDELRAFRVSTPSLRFTTLGNLRSRSTAMQRSSASITAISILSKPTSPSPIISSQRSQTP